MESPTSYVEGVVIINLLQNLTGLSPNGEEDVEIDLVCGNTWLNQKSQWRSNLHWISAAKEEPKENFTSHLLDYGFDSILESLVMYLGLDSLVVLMVTFMRISYSAKVYKHSDISNMDNRAFSIMIPLRIPRKADTVL